MAVYFDFRVNTKSNSVINCVEWHRQLSYLAVGSSIVQSLCSYVAVHDHLGEPLNDLNELCEENNAVVSLSWHPTKKILVAGFTTGDLRLWNGQPDFINIPSPHTSAVKLMKWSELGNRLISIDHTGVVIGWKEENRTSIITKLFKYNLNDAPLGLEFCCAKPGLDINVLAQKAVAGDEKALDIFSAWRPKTGVKKPAFSVDNLCSYVATSSNIIHFIDENGNVSKSTTCETSVKRILQHKTKEILVVILSDGSVNQYGTSVNDKIHNISKVKLNDVANDAAFIWIDDDILCCPTKKYALRFLELNTGDTYVLWASANNINVNDDDSFSTICYLQSKGALCGGSRCGYVTVWKKKSAAGGGVCGVNNWEELSTCKLKNEIIYSAWGFQNCAVVAANTLYILQEHELCSNYNKKVCVIQKTANEVIVANDKNVAHLSTDLKIIGVAVSEEHVAVWSGRTVAVYNLTDLTAFNVSGTFSCECETLVIYEQSLIILPNSAVQNGKLLVSTFQGTVKQTLDSDGQPIATHLNQCYLACATITGMVQLWDLSRREAKLHVYPKDLANSTSIDDFGEVVTIRVNCDGTKVSLTIANSNLIPSPSIYIWHTENDTIISYKFESCDSQIFDDVRYITAHYWDSEESSLLVCETKSLENDDQEQSNTIADDYPVGWTTKIVKNLATLVTFFVSKDDGIIFHDATTVSSSYVKLLGIDVPHFITLKKSITDTFSSVDKVLMNYFDEECADNGNVRSATIQFCFNLSAGNLDNAFKKTIGTINNKKMWTNLMKICIKKKRLDVAQICLGHMCDARGVAALRSVQHESSVEVKLATLAIHLEMLEEAEKLYEAAERYDLMNKFYQNSNRWDEAIRVAENRDRINVKNTYDAYGRYLENKGEIEKSIKTYELANTHRKHVPRLLLSNPVALENYIQKSKDTVLMKWWAQYVESTNNMPLALKYYQMADDYLSIVRILCFLENVEQAAEIANTSQHPAACHHLARHYENIGHIENAVKFYVKSKVYANAIRICKENGLDEQLWQLSFNADTRDKLETAKYFENVDPYKATILYEKAGNVNRALNLAFEHNLHECVEQLTYGLRYENDAELIEKSARFFIQKENFDIAVKLLAKVKKYDEAIRICNKRRIHMTEELADILTPDEDDPNRIDIINQLGEIAFSVGNYHLAARKFTEAGNKIKAMKALLKSGDTKKIIFFANVSREKEIYIMAANYLQTLDWHMQPDYLKHIINFYTKGKATNLLANFYVACAQIEVDEYGNYEKCINALNEASRCLGKDSSQQYGQAIEYIAKKITSVKKIMAVKRFEQILSYSGLIVQMQFEKGGGDAAMLQCRTMLNTELDFVRKGDIYSLMIEHLIKSDDWDAAAQVALEMKNKLANDNLAYYIPKETLQKLGIANTRKNDSQRSESVFDEIEDISQMAVDTVGPDRA